MVKRSSRWFADISNTYQMSICFTQVIAVRDRAVNRTSVSAVGGLDIAP